MKKTLCLVLSTVVMLVCASNALAAMEGNSDEYENIYTIEQGEPIGTPEDEDGILIEDYRRRATGLPFTMEAKAVYNLLTTKGSSGKQFTGGAFDGFANEGLYIRGKLTNSMQSTYPDLLIKVGACYYNESKNTYYSVYPQYFKTGKECTAWIPKVINDYNIIFNNQITYYGHITNHTGIGSVSGLLSFSVSTNPGK